MPVADFQRPGEQPGFPQAWDVQSETNETTVYSVVIYGPGDGICTCRGFRSHGHCKHVDGLCHDLFDVAQADGYITNG